MKLGKLLGAGKSFFGGQEPAAYRADRSVYLPKFNEGKNPFSSKAPHVAMPEPGPQKTALSDAVSPAPAPAIVPAAVPAAVIRPAPQVEAPEKPVFSAPALASIAGEKPSLKPMTKPARAQQWAAKINQLWAVAKPAPQAAPAGPMPNVQPELLSLDAVKVVHNDLSDADVEVVPMKSQTIQAKTATMPSMTMDFMSEPVYRSA